MTLTIAYISHALVAPGNRYRLTSFNALGRGHLTGLAPRRWEDAEMGREYVNPEAREGIRFLPTLGGSHPNLHFYRPGSLLKELRKLKADVVHVEQEPYGPAAFQSMLASLRLGIPLVVTAWQNNPGRARLLAARAVLGRASALVAGTQQIEEVWKPYCRKVEVIPFGVDVERFAPPAPDPRPGSPALVGYLGRLSTAKGVDLLIQAAAAGGRWRLLIDDAPGGEALKRLSAELGVQDRVEFRKISAAEVPAAYRELDVLVLPSRTTPRWREQFGRVLLEAMASGTPVIGSSSGSIPEVIGGAGIIFPDGDAGALAGAIERITSDRGLWARLRRQGIQRSRSFAWDQVSARLATLYEEVLAAR